MNIINKLTLRQLRMNKKRTLVTIIGTVISAAMITAVATLGLSFMDVMQRQSIAQFGEWHVKYKNLNERQVEAVRKNSKVETAFLSKETGYAYLTGGKNQNKPYLYIQYLSPEGFQKLPVKLSEGRLPEKPGEIVISKEIISGTKEGYSVGDMIDLSIGQRSSTAKDTKDEGNEPLLQNYSLIWENNKVAESLTEDSKQSFQIVGLIEKPSWEYNWSPGYTAISYIDEKALGPDGTCDLSVVFHKVNTKLFDTADNIATANKITEYDFNNDLLRYYGIFKDDSVKQMLYTLTVIIMAIIVIGSVSLIFNAFAISVSERSRYLGMLSSVGATRRQKRNSVFFEGAIIGIISIPIGIFAGYAGLGIAYLFINPILLDVLNVYEGFRLVIYPVSLITAILVSSATILISTYIPARRASNISAIDAIRQVSDVKVRGRQVKTFRITRKIFGMEGDLGLKNLKRNKGRYKATVFSLIISMVLFLVVSSFTQYLKKSLVMTQDGINFDIQTTVNTGSDTENQRIVKRITALDDIEELSMHQVLNAITGIKKDNAADYIIEDQNIKTIDGEYEYQVTVDVLDDNSLKEYAKEIGADYEQLNNTAQPAAIIIDTMRFKDNAADKYVEAKVLKAAVNDLLKPSYIDNDTSSSVAMHPVRIAALTKEMPMGIMTLGKIAGFHMIMSEAAFDSMVKGQEKLILPGVRTEMYFNSKQPRQLQTALEEIQGEVGANSLTIFNVFNYKNNEQQALLLVSIFTYAFIILITAICIANIINTISTSIALRKREFAMLKSIGITPKGFNKMLNYESIFYGIKALIYGLPISFLVMYLMYRVLMTKFEYAFIFPTASVGIVIASVFLIVGTAMLYSSRKVRKENIIDALKQEII